MNSVLKRFENSINSLNLQKYTDHAKRIIVAFSGGADSCLLLHLTHAYFSFRDVKVECAHLNHMIRGEEADRDEEFCRMTAEKLGVTFHVKRVNIPQLTHNGGSVEEVARRARYEFFHELIGESTETFVFTAHNSDDNLETVLFNLIRGSSLKGLCGIPPSREGKFLRPLLTFSSSDIRELCESLKIDYVTDSTNLQSDYTRNYIRNNIVPSMREIVPTPEISVMRVSSLLRSDEDYLSDKAENFINENCKDYIPNASAIALHDAILSRVIVRKYNETASMIDPSLHLENIHISEIIRQLKEKNEKTFSITLPGRINFRSENGKSEFLLPLSDSEFVDSNVVLLEFDKPIEKNGYIITATKKTCDNFFEKDQNIYNLSIHKSLKFDKIKGNMKIRVRESGDTFRYGGMTHKVKKIFSEKKLTATERRSIPVICDDEGILWIPGFPLRDGLCDGDGENIVIFVAKK